MFPSLELESLPSVFARSDSTSVSSSRFTDMGIPAKGWEVGGGGVIILSVSVEWERLFEGAIIRGTAIILENAVTSNKKKILFTVWKQYGLKITLFGFNTKKKKRNFNCRYETNHKFDKRREKVIKENKESLQKC